MKFAILKVINGNYYVHAEGITDITKAKTMFHGLCQTLWNSPDVLDAEVHIVNPLLEVVEDYHEHITHTPVDETTE